MLNAIQVTVESLAKLKRIHNKAVKNGKAEFQFDGHTLLVSYAKYLIEYMAIQLKIQMNQHGIFTT